MTTSGPKRRSPYAVDLDRIRQDVGRDVQFWRPQPGTNIIRLLPRAGGVPYVSAWVHFGVGQDHRTLFCPARMREERCYPCEVSARLRRSTDANAQAEGLRLLPRQRFFMAIVDLNAPDKGVQVWGFGSMVFTQLLRILDDPDWQYEHDGVLYDPLDPEYGRDFKLIQTVKGSESYQVEYQLTPTPRVSRLSNPAWLDDVERALGQVVSFIPYERQRLIVEGYIGGGDDSESAACPSCGASIRADWRICPYCTVTLMESDAPTPTARSSSPPQDANAPTLRPMSLDDPDEISAGVDAVLRRVRAKRSAAADANA